MQPSLSVWLTAPAFSRRKCLTAPKRPSMAASTMSQPRQERWMERFSPESPQGFGCAIFLGWFDVDKFGKSMVYMPTEILQTTKFESSPDFAGKLLFVFAHSSCEQFLIKFKGRQHDQTATTFDPNNPSEIISQDSSKLWTSSVSGPNTLPPLPCRPANISRASRKNGIRAKGKELRPTNVIHLCAIDCSHHYTQMIWVVNNHLRSIHVSVLPLTKVNLQHCMLKQKYLSKCCITFACERPSIVVVAKDWHLKINLLDLVIHLAHRWTLSDFAELRLGWQEISTQSKIELLRSV